MFLLPGLPEKSRRFEDKPVSRWLKWCLFSVLLSLAFIGGATTQIHSSAEFRAMIYAFGGGLLGSVTLWGGLAKSAFDNLKELASARGERIEELEHALAAEQVERRSEIERIEASHKKELAAVLAKLAAIEAQYSATLMEKIALQRELSKIAPGHRAMPKKRILVVDDDEEMRKLNKFVLRGAGYEVETAESAVRALDMIEKAGPGEKFDFVLSDYSMPYLDGEEMIKILRAVNEDGLKIAIYTGHGQQMTRDFSQKTGIPVWLKPLENSELCRLVAEALKQ